MYESRTMSSVFRSSITVGAAFSVALLGAGVASADEPVQVRSRLADVCLDALNGNNTAAVVNPCDQSKTQLWNFNSAGQIESVAFPGACATISNPADTTAVMLAPCRTDADNQRWDNQTNGQISSVLGPCLNIDGGVANPATPVIAYHCIADVTDEQWDRIA